MARPRSANPLNLPARMYQKHGAFYYVSPENKWIRLSADHAEALELHRKYELAPSGAIFRIGEKPLSERLKWAPMARQLLKQVTASASTRKIKIGIGMSDLLEMLMRANGCCEVSGTPFREDRIGRSKRRPFAASVDRVDSGKGYVPGNVRIVCQAVNLALSDFGDEVLMEWVASIRSQDRIKEIKQ